jgi:hypothetical protein
MLARHGIVLSGGGEGAPTWRHPTSQLVSFFYLRSNIFLAGDVYPSAVIR